MYAFLKNKICSKFVFPSRVYHISILRKLEVKILCMQIVYIIIFLKQLVHKYKSVHNLFLPSKCTSSNAQDIKMNLLY